MGLKMREMSKANVTTEGGYTNDNINTGSLQRIADATELMAQNYTTLLADRDLYKKWYREEQEKTEKLHRSIKSYKGTITKLKKKLS